MLIKTPMCMLSCFSDIPLSATQWTVTWQPLCPWDYPGKNPRVGFQALFREIFPIQESNPCHLIHIN